MIKHIKSLVILTLIFSMISCAQRENPKIGSGTGGGSGQDGQPKASEKYYLVELNPMRTNDEIVERVFEIPRAKKDQKVTVGYHFNSKNSRKLKVITQFVNRKCSKKLNKISYQISKLGNGKKVKYKNVNKFNEYQIEPNTDYVYEVISKPSDCAKFDVGANIWLGPEDELPEHVRVCEYKRHNLETELVYYFTKYASPVTVYSSFSKKLFSNNTICGEVVNFEKQSSSMDGATGSVVGQVESANGTKYNYEMIFADKSYGTLSCKRDGKVFHAAELLDCREIILDKRDFKE